MLFKMFNKVLTAQVCDATEAQFIFCCLAHKNYFFHSPLTTHDLLSLFCPQTLHRVGLIPFPKREGAAHLTIIKHFIFHILLLFFS